MPVELPPSAQLMKALAEREAMLRALFENPLVAVIVSDVEGRIRSASAAALDLLGATLEDVLGEPLDLFIAPSTVAATDDEVELHRPNGARRRARYRPQILEDGLEVGVLQDVEQAYRLRARQPASQLALGVAHDLLNHYAVVQFGLQELEAELKGAESHELVAAMRAATARSHLLSRGLLDLGKGLHTRTDDVVQFTLHALSSAPLDLDVRLLDDPPPTEAVFDPTELSDVLLNVVFDDALGLHEGAIGIRIAHRTDLELHEHPVRDYVVIELGLQTEAAPRDAAERAPRHAHVPGGAAIAQQLARTLGGDLRLSSLEDGPPRVEVFVPAAPSKA